MGKFFFDNALLPDGWARDVAIETDAAGRITGVAPNAKTKDASDGAIALPGVSNLHSHAFQRAMAGLGERRGDGNGDDDFWSWREAMYHFVTRLTPEDNRAIATELYVEMLEAGYTGVAEFHYLHHQPDGAPYSHPGEMADSIFEAACEAGLALTLLPVLYAQGGFGGAPLGGGQKRFHHDTESFLKLVRYCREKAHGENDVVVGMAPHSLRAVGPDMIKAVVEGCPDGPVHIHIAEQTKEVDDCIAWSGAAGARPVEWLLDHMDVDGRWCLVHATHMTSAETRRLAKSGAVAGLCPTTEANLGDGVFNGVEYFAAGGAWGVGTDSHIRIDLAEELRMLEVSQRLRDRRRLRLAPPGGSNGRRLYTEAAKGGAQALARNAGVIAPGACFDIVALDATHPVLAGKSGDQWFDSWIFAGGKSCVSDVWVSGRHLVRGGAHIGRDAARRGFAAAMARLMAA